MHRTVVVLLAVAALGCGGADRGDRRLPAETADATDREPRIDVELIAGAAALEPGQSIWLGIRFVIERGWHIYWENPGDAGVATRARLTASDDSISFGPIRYPGPQRYTTAGDIVTYGYENTVTLLVEATRAAAGPSPGELTIAVDTRWLGCSQERCVPGKKRVELRLPSSAAASDGLRAARLLLPRPVGDGPGSDLATKWSGPEHEPTLEIAIPATDAAPNAEFFPGRGLEVVRQELHRSGRQGAMLTVSLRRDPTVKAPASGVVRLRPSVFVSVVEPPPAARDDGR